MIISPPPPLKFPLICFDAYTDVITSLQSGKKVLQNLVPDYHEGEMMLCLYNKFLLLA